MWGIGDYMGTEPSKEKMPNSRLDPAFDSQAVSDDDHWSLISARDSAASGKNNFVMRIRFHTEDGRSP